MGKYAHIFEVRRQMDEESEPSESQPQESQSPQSQLPEGQPPKSRPPEPPKAGSESRLQQSQPQRSRPRESQPPEGRLNFLAGLPEVKGHLELPHQIGDHLFRHLDPFEQAAYLQLYRLAWGGRERSGKVLISNERLAERSNVSLSKIKKVTAALEAKGLVKKLDRPHGLNTFQGVLYEVPAPAWQLQRSQPQESQPRESRPPHAPNKEDHKETYQSDCPDCFGTNFWYPEGTNKGVKRCTHERLKGK